MKFLDILNSAQFIIGTALLLLAVYTFRFKESKVGKSLILFLLLTSAWCFFSVMIMQADQIESKILLTRMRLLAPIFLPATIFSLALDLNGEIKINKAYVFTVPCCFAFFIIGPWHELFVNNYHYISFEGRDILAYKNGFIFHVHNIMSRLYCLGSFFIIIKGMKGRHRFQKRTGWMIIAAIALPLIVDTLAVNFYEIFRYLQIVPLSLGFTSILITYALFGHGSLELVPYARSQVVSYLSDACLMWDYKGMLVDCNQAGAILFNIPSNIRGFNLSQLIYLKANDQEVAWHDGRVFQVRYENIQDSSGHTVGSFTLMRDITNLKQAEEKLIKMNNVKTNIMGVLSHDLCGHVGQLSFITELLMTNQKNLKEQEVMELTEGAFFLSKDLNLFLSNLLDWSKEQSKDWDVKQGPVYIKILVDDVWEFLSKSANLKNQKLQNEIPSDLIIMTDSKMIEIILRNLIYNAIKHSPVNSMVKVNGDQSGVNVWNQGEISESDIELINQYFEKDEVETLPNSGLGHKICKEFSKELLMRIFASNVNDGVSFSLSTKKGPGF